MPINSGTDIALESETFSLYGKTVNDLDWMEFDARVAGKEFWGIGGENRRIAIKKLIQILSKDADTPLEQLAHTRFRELVGEKAGYLGYFVVSGYNTFYFFKADGHVKHVVYADCDLNVLAHAELGADFGTSWLKQLFRLHEQVRSA